MYRIVEKLKERWNIQTNYQLIMILLVFTINGSLTIMLVKPILNLIGISEIETTAPYIFWAVRITLVFFLYQILLIMVGSVLGQYKFFWNMEKKMLSRFGLRKKLDDTPNDCE